MAGNDGTEVPLRSRQPTAPLVDRDEPETALERQRNGARFPEIKVSGQARRNGRRQRVNLEPRGQMASGCPMHPATVFVDDSLSDEHASVQPAQQIEVVAGSQRDQRSRVPPQRAEKRASGTPALTAIGSLAAGILDVVGELPLVKIDRGNADTVETESRSADSPSPPTECGDATQKRSAGDLLAWTDIATYGWMG